MVRLFYLLLIFSLLLPIGCTKEDVKPPPLLESRLYYRAVNIDVDGASSKSKTVVVFRNDVDGIDVVSSTNARVLDEPLGNLPYILDEVVINNCLTIKTWVCYSVPYLPIVSADTYGAKFGISFNLDPDGECQSSPPTYFVIKDNTISSLRYPNPYTDVPYYVNPITGEEKYWTVGTVVYLNELNHLKDPESGVVWIDNLYDPSEPNYNWWFEFDVFGDDETLKGAVDLKTSANFNQKKVTGIPYEECTDFALPVTWLNIEGYISKDNSRCNTIEFTIADQVDVDHYEVQVSKTGHKDDFETIGVIEPLTLEDGATHTYFFDHCPEN